MGIFFDDIKPRVSVEEWKKKVRNILSAHDFTTKEIDFVQGLFQGDMYETNPKEMGLQADEIERGVSWLKQNKKLHSLSDEQITALDEELKKFL